MKLSCNYWKFPKKNSDFHQEIWFSNPNFVTFLSILRNNTNFNTNNTKVYDVENTQSNSQHIGDMQERFIIYILNMTALLPRVVDL